MAQSVICQQFSAEVLGMFGQTFQASDLGVIAFLVVLEALLSADNALVLAIMVRHLPPPLQKKALLYGLGGAFIFRFIAILFATVILSLWWLQAIGALYLMYLPIKHFVKSSQGDDHKECKGGFWPTVIAVEVTDIAFAIDSVLAGVALIKGADKIWVVYSGAIVGVILLRFAAGVFVSLLARFPALDHLAYALVAWVGVKLAFMSGHSFVMWYHAQNPGARLGFYIPEMSPFVFWGLMALICIVGAWLAFRNPAKLESTDDPSVEESNEPETE